ncbi:MAG: sugar ABC transporter permease [Coprothermobacterota bacterium]|nr:sugar ABC transporter permease [Coprothermobacterota bacterium]
MNIAATAIPKEVKQSQRYRDPRPFSVRFREHMRRNRLAYLLLIPAFVVICATVIYPFIYAFNLATTDTNMYNINSPTKQPQFVGLGNFGEIFSNPEFYTVLGRTILWTVVNVICHVAFGLWLAVLLNRNLKMRGLYRTLLVLPWAIPQLIVAMMWKNEFNTQYGSINLILQSIGLPAIPWLTDPFWAFIAVCITNIWLGIPFMMVIILGGLQSISPEYYEAAQIDGATAWQQFRNITIPFLKPVLTPAIILGTVWTFNNLNIIYLITKGGPNNGTQILVTYVYRAAFDFYRYGYAAAFSVVIFLILLIFCLFYIRATRGAQEV